MSEEINVHKYEVGSSVPLDFDQQRRLAEFIGRLQVETGTRRLRFAAVIGKTGVHKMQSLAPDELDALSASAGIPEEYQSTKMAVKIDGGL
ncbi:hypothetical protein SEA_MUSETTA_20 [Microbacterium phage Musetta]|nr:hypothetical protein SEA_MUSETTA_20 [Microbacterium phage Musetta]QYC54142.1 hypothetical protein SEA_WELCOME_20 [Microbacterium phage Welcome]UVK62438.1 hypothetical protein SEA_YUMA_20 [Microbacterium phage Yuma]WMI33894.1 hypothetical protein SEA_ERENYEAGER_19 [Microbacterium phage Erenyeager]